MIFTETELAGAYVLEIERREDSRGFFARVACEDEFAAHGLNGRFVQDSLSWNPLAGTLRGLHFQVAPHEEDKLVRVTRGAVFDVIVDLRGGSPTRGRWIGVELSADNHRQIYIPKGFAHGFQTLVPETEVLYGMTVRYQPGTASGIRWDDPDLAIEWPDVSSRLLSSQDRQLPLFYQV